MNISTFTVSEQDWPDLSIGFHDLGFEQSLCYAQSAARRINARLELIGVTRGDQTLALAAVRIKQVPGFRKGIAWIPGGPIMASNGDQGVTSHVVGQVLSALKDRLVREQGNILRLRLAGLSFQNPDDLRATVRSAGFLPTTLAPIYRSIAMDLRQGSDALMQKMNGKWRTDLRFSLKSGLALDVNSSTDSAPGLSDEMKTRFMAMFSVVQGAKGFSPDIPPEFHFDAVKAVDKKDYRLDILVARHGAQDVAGVVLGTAGRCTTYLFGATLDAGRPLRAGYFLQWEGMKLARERGSDWYDMGGIDAETNPEVTRFKERMGGQPIFAEAFEARPAGVFPIMVGGLESLRTRFGKRRR
jgi:hypothetical protein